MLLTCSFLSSVFIMCPASATMTMTTTTPMTVVCSSMLSLLTTVTMASSLMGLPVTSGQDDVVLPPSLMQRSSGSVVGLATVPQQQCHSQIPLQAYANHAMGHQQVGFSFKVEPPTIFICIGACSGM